MNRVLSWVVWSYHAARAAQQKYLLRCEKVQKLPDHFCNAEEIPDGI
ncbi:hypothetical protein [Ruegeria sp. HKCCD7318]|nr:hypothetical protein [Ruegeria sp. HKCCD7318]